MSIAVAHSGQDDPNYKWKVLIVIMIGTLMATLDSSIVNVSIPSIMADFGASIDSIEWVVTGYMLAFAVLVPLTAWMRDRVGHKILYCTSLAIFVLGSVLCGLSWNVPTIVGARVIQAIGGGAIPPSAIAMLTEAFEPHERGQAMGWWGVGAIIGPAIGPTVGGYLTKYLGWPSIFFVNLPLGIIGLALALKLLVADKPKEKKHQPFDAWGFAFLSIALVSFLYGVSKGEHDGWTSTIIITCWIVAFVSFTGFLVVEIAVPNGIIDLRLFKFPTFSVVMFLTMVRSMALLGGVFLLPLFLEQLKGLDEVEAGLILLPGALLIGVLMPITGRLTDKFGSRYLAGIGLGGLVGFLYLYKDINIMNSDWQIIMPMLIRGVGIAFLIAPLMTAAMNTIPREKISMVSSMMTLVQQVGGSVGIALLSAVLTHRVHFHMNAIGSNLNLNSSGYEQIVENYTQRAQNLGFSQQQAHAITKAMVIRTASVRASEKGYQDAFIFGAGIVLVSMFTIIWLPAKPADRGSMPEEALAME